MKIHQKFATTLLCTALLASCGQENPPVQKASEAPDAPAAPQQPSQPAEAAKPVQIVERANKPQLTAEYAAMRKQQIANVDYQISVALSGDSENYSGTVVAETTIDKPLQQPLTVDFSEGTVKKVRVDGQEIPYDYNGNFITIQPDQLKVGVNAITVDFEHPYSSDGSGLHHFKDPQDGNVYLYTHFEPYKANRFAPLFDQPDLKASYTVDVTAPGDWQVVTTTREDKVDELSDGRKHWHFPATKKFSTYIFPLHAGPFVVWESDADGIPLRLMARKSLAENVKPDDWFSATQQAFAFYQKYFDIPYQFGKYDQLIVPDFTIGAMENVGAVTFNEAYVSRGEKTQAQRQRLANTIAHEMAHMWFGDLVTMKWWNGLWLKESFATYMASLALSHNPDFKDVWQNFYLGSKRWAYDSDSLVTTHPIELPVANTDEAFSNFDGITYGKGGSVLEQLPYYLGKEAFRQGVSSYLKDFSFGNAELKDFMGHLGRAANKNLDEWTQAWLYKAGVNTISATYQCKNDKVTYLNLHQTAPKEFPVLREQKVQLGLYRMQDDRMTRVQALPVVYSGEHTEVKEAVGAPCPQILFPNDEDWGYVKVALDDKSVEQVTQHINDIESSFTRLMLWQSQFDSVIDGKLPLNQWVEFAVDNAGAETDINIIRLISTHLQNAAAYLHRIDLPTEVREQRLQAIESFVWRQLNSAPAGSDAQQTWFDTFTAVAHSSKALKSAEQLLTGSLEIDGLQMDQDKRWELVILLNRRQHGDYDKLLQDEMKRDNSARGQNAAISAQAIRPTKEAKTEWLDNILNKRDQYKLSQIKAAAHALFPAEQLNLYRDVSAKIFTAVPTVNATDDTLYNKAYALVFPIVCDKTGIAQYSDVLEQNPDLIPALGRVLKNRKQQSERCLAMPTTYLE
ncbi:aminopeptidase N [Microbulbifer hainanensis]|uniref:aminopeptidase N n=1 Tax=Microbulbifer hainanensis TaxID=2735675 RepID=UPI001865FAC2|nr:aminopeptidase N [Microbulbifer hainanensis]